MKGKRMYVRYVASHPALPAERRMRTHHTAQPHSTATPSGRKAKDMNVKLDSAAATIAVAKAWSAHRPADHVLQVRPA